MHYLNIKMNAYDIDKTFPKLAKYLQSFGLEDALEEITYQICQFSHLDEKFDKVDGKDTITNNVEISQWSVGKLCQWIKSLKFMEGYQNVVKTIAAEEIDGFTFLHLTENQWIQYGLDVRYFILLGSIRQGWLTGWGPSIPVPKGVPVGVATNIIADLSSCSKELAYQLIQADDLCTRTGKGMFYGQLVVLG